MELLRELCKLRNRNERDRLRSEVCELLERGEERDAAGYEQQAPAPPAKPVDNIDKTLGWH